jgi:hypothetical protein
LQLSAWNSNLAKNPNSKAEKLLAEKLRKVGWSDLGGAGISAGDVDTLRGPKRPIKKGPRTGKGR